MKRKVALGGRLRREFSRSMSVEPGERYLPKLKRRKRASELQCSFANRNAPEFVPSGSVKNCAEQTPSFFRGTKKRTAQCCR